MPSADLVLPKRMSRVAVVAPRSRVRDALVALAASGSVELVGNLPPPEGEEVEALRRLHRAGKAAATEPAVLDRPPDIVALERAAEEGLLEGEVELRRRARLAVEHGSFAAWVGWAPDRRDRPAQRAARADRLRRRRARPARPGWSRRRC